MSEPRQFRIRVRPKLQLVGGVDSLKQRILGNVL